MTLSWGSLPLLPLKCILDHLSTEDALAAMSTCRHWRSAIVSYEGRKDTLKLQTRNVEKNKFLTRIFRRHTRKLNIYIDYDTDIVNRFMDDMLPKFFETLKLQELIFIGPSYFSRIQDMPSVTFRRIITEGLVYKNLHSLRKLAFMGCHLNWLIDGENRCPYYVKKYPQSLTFNSNLQPADAVLSSSNIHMMQYSTINYLIVDYNQITYDAMETLSHLPNFRHLTFNVTKNCEILFPLDWHRLKHRFKHTILLNVNIISVPYKKFSEIARFILVEGITLMSLKVMFCKNLCEPLVSHVARRFGSTLRELVWVDAPAKHRRAPRPTVQPSPTDAYSQVNPFVLLCWQCTHLRRLVIHGYWVWQYDLLGFVRLRKSLSHLEISSIYQKFKNELKPNETSLRVLVTDPPPTLNAVFIEEVNKHYDGWVPMSWRQLPPALQAGAEPALRADYVRMEASIAHHTSY